ncbi:hypothetical protein B0H14DRAFT_3501800 [Mycena olivaceomarginata]|nr:hypothetical protein B0H14DRAFT_3501800 [Mycena olivaceomarginata]
MGFWLVALILEIFLFGIGVLQTWIYFDGRPTDVVSIKATVLVVLCQLGLQKRWTLKNVLSSFLETTQVVFFSRSSYLRFVDRFGQLQLDLIWADSLQLLAAYLSAFVVQIYFASRIHQLTKGRGRFSLAALGIYTIYALAVVQILAGIAQMVLSYELRSFFRLDETKPVTTLQTAASLACDLFITAYLSIFLTSQKGGIVQTNSLMNMLIYDAINHGVLTALSSGVTMVLFLTLPKTFWFFLGLAPSSKLYMNSMLGSYVLSTSFAYKSSHPSSDRLNIRQRIRDRLASTDKGWNSIPMAPIADNSPSSAAVKLYPESEGNCSAVAIALSKQDGKSEFPDDV